MTARFLVDTNVASQPVMRQPDRRMLDRWRQFRDEIGLAAPVLHELRFGALRLPPSYRRRTVEEFIDELLASDAPLFPYDRPAAEWHAAERARLVGLGLTPPYVDGQIAAIAATNDLIVVTANVADFRHFHGLRVEDWSAE